MGWLQGGEAIVGRVVQVGCLGRETGIPSATVVFARTGVRLGVMRSPCHD
jgi:hypothetical protein